MALKATCSAIKKIVTQIYEVQDRQEAEAMVGLGVDRIGSVILSQKSWQVGQIGEVAGFMRHVEAHHCLIPLFSDEDTIFRLIDYYRPDVMHFCESLVSQTGERIPADPFVTLQRKVKERFPHVQIMRSIPIAIAGGKKVTTLEIARDFEETTDCFLTDTWLGKEPVDGFIGITGKICNWDTARDLVLSSRIPVILAGGLAPENVYDGIMAVRPFGVDSCTQTNRVDDEGAPVRFRKDVLRVAWFLREVHRGQANLQGRNVE